MTVFQAMAQESIADHEKTLSISKLMNKISEENQRNVI